MVHIEDHQQVLHPLQPVQQSVQRTCQRAGVWREGTREVGGKEEARRCANRDIPEADRDIPEADRDIPEADRDIPEADRDIPEADRDIPEAS
jgi:hypothetical protein